MHKRLLTAVLAFGLLVANSAILRAQEDSCASGSDDQWSSFAHDNRQTSASTLGVGDPNGVTLVWTRSFNEISNFTNPTVTGNIIYISSDQTLNAYRLQTGAPAGRFIGPPEMGASNRGNTTVANITALGRDVVFATGGNFNSITALETNLESSPKIWSNNVSTFNTPNGLGSQTRFNTCKVVDVSGTQVLFVSTDPAAGTGRIWAFNAATGALYPGWGTNPVVLDAGAKHGPAVNGGKLYVGTAIGGSNIDGSLYQIDAATGTIDWTFVGTNSATEGWPSGVSTEGDFLYGATRDAANVGVRYKIDKSGAAPVVVWSDIQGVGLYGTPTIGRSSVYFPLDIPSFGLLQVDKASGIVAHNFASENICGVSPFQIPLIVTLSCDAYLFAGDRNSRWWLLNAVDGTIEWYRQWPLVTGGEIVSGTALATYTVTGDDYAVVANRQLNGTVGQISVYKLNAGPRPRLIQCVNTDTVLVPLGTGPGNPRHIDDVFMNVGNTPLNFSALAITDPPPNGLSSAQSNAQTFRAGIVNASQGFDGYNTIASAQTLTKRQRMFGLAESIDGGEFMTSEIAQMESNQALIAVRGGARSMAASAAMIRTSAVLVGGAAVPTSIAPGGVAGLDWQYDGTGLGRGQDANDLNFTHNDPDFNYNGSSGAVFHILYQGGCLFAADTLHFNSNGSYETVYNHGALGDDAGPSTEFNFGADVNTPNSDLYDATLIVADDSIAGGPQPNFGAELHGSMYSGAEGFVPNVAPGTGACGFDVARNLTLGAKRTGGCPGTPVDIQGEIITHSMSDTTFEATAGSPCAAIGLIIVQTEVGTYDPLYGDFKLIRWAVTNRDAAAKGPIYLATEADWDINSGNNTGLVSDAFGGYALWDKSLPTVAYGYLNPNQPSTYSGVDPSADSPHKIWIMSNPLNVYDPAPWSWGTVAKEQIIWSELVHGVARANYGPAQEDKAGLLVNRGINLGPHGSGAVHQAVFGVDASSNNAAIIEANAAALAKRAARWGGFARGDVNDDGVVDLADVCWLVNGNPIYPAAYSGDVDADGDNDAADVARLLSFVSGNAASRPLGAWRF